MEPRGGGSAAGFIRFFPPVANPPVSPGPGGESSGALSGRRPTVSRRRTTTSGRCTRRRGNPCGDGHLVDRPVGRHKVVERAAGFRPAGRLPHRRGRPTLAASSAPAHIGAGLERDDKVTSESRHPPRAAAVSRGAKISACAVGSAAAFRADCGAAGQLPRNQGDGTHWNFTVFGHLRVPVPGASSMASWSLSGVVVSADAMAPISSRATFSRSRTLRMQPGQKATQLPDEAPDRRSRPGGMALRYLFVTQRLPFVHLSVTFAEIDRV